MKKTAIVIFSGRMPTDRKSEASDVGTLVVSQADALRIAREIEEKGEYYDTFKLEYVTPAGAYGGRAVPGHGVTIEYASGRTRNVHSEGQ